MTKTERIAQAICPSSPTGRHVFEMRWEGTRYYGVCRYCPEVREEDAGLGIVPRQEYTRSRHSGKFVGDA